MKVKSLATLTAGIALLLLLSLPNLCVAASPPDGVCRYEQSDALLLYAGTWYGNSSAPSASGGSFRYANTSASSLTLKFTGTYLAWITKTSPIYGIAQVVLDGGAPEQVDLYSDTETWQVRVWEKTVDSGTHTLTISWTGAKNPVSANTYIGVDAFEVLGTLQYGGSRLTVAAGGDVMGDRGVGSYIDKYGGPAVFAKVKGFLSTADIAFVNLEGAISNIGSRLTWKSYTFRARPALTQGLVSAGIDVVSLANNHILDYGSSAMLDCINRLDTAGVKHAGAGANAGRRRA
jgi:hypothetical protein